MDEEKLECGHTKRQHEVMQEVKDLLMSSGLMPVPDGRRSRIRAALMTVRHALLGCIKEPHYVLEPGWERPVLVGKICFVCMAKYPLRSR